MIGFVSGLFCLKVVLVWTLISRMDTFYIYLFGDTYVRVRRQFKGLILFFYDLVSRYPTYIVRLGGKKNGSQPVGPNTVNF